MNNEPMNWSSDLNHWKWSHAIYMSRLGNIGGRRGLSSFSTNIKSLLKVQLRSLTLERMTWSYMIIVNMSSSKYIETQTKRAIISI